MTLKQENYIIANLDIMEGALTREITSIIRRYSASTGKQLQEIAKEADITQSYFSEMLNGRKPILEKHAEAILIALDYTKTQAKRLIAEIKMRAVLEGLDKTSRGIVIENVKKTIGSITINGNNNSISQNL